jgi:hypothetical protein
MTVLATLASALAYQLGRRSATAAMGDDIRDVIRTHFRSAGGDDRG